MFVESRMRALVPGRLDRSPMAPQDNFHKQRVAKTNWELKASRVGSGEGKLLARALFAGLERRAYNLGKGA